MGLLVVGIPFLGFATMAVAWLILPRIRALRDDRCWSCGYDLSGLTKDGRCPECGEAAQGRTSWIAPGWHDAALLLIPVCGWAGSLLFNPLLSSLDIVNVAFFHAIPLGFAMGFTWARQYGLRCTPWFTALGGTLAATATVVLIDRLAIHSNEGDIVLVLASVWCAPACGPGLLAGAMIDRMLVRRAERRRTEQTRS